MIEEWFKAALSDSGDVTAWPLQASEMAEPPFAVYSRQATEFERTLDGPAGIPLVTFEVMLFAEGFAAVHSLASKIRLNLPNFKGGPAGVTVLDVWIEDESDSDPVEFPGDEKPWFAVSQTWVVRQNED